MAISTSFRLWASLLVVVLSIVGFQLSILTTSMLFVVCFVVLTFLYAKKLGLVLSGTAAFLMLGSTVLVSGLLGTFIQTQYVQTIAVSLGLVTFVAIGIEFATQSKAIVKTSVLGWGRAQTISLIGPLFFCISFLASRFLPQGNKFAWVMNNDAVNNILMVRDLTNDGGVLIGDGGNPVPFTTSLLSIFLVQPNTDYEQHGNLMADVLGMQMYWLFTGILLGLAAGLLGAEISRRQNLSQKWQILSAGVASFATTMWFIVGYPIEYGFLNAALGLALLLVATLAFQFQEEQPAVVLGVLFLSSLLIIATWTPTVIFILAFIAIVVVRQRKTIFVSDLSVLFTWGFPMVITIAFGLVITIPSFIRTSSLLSSPGGVEHIPTAMLWLLPLCLVLISLVVFGPKSYKFIAYSSVGIAQLIAVNGLLFLNRNLEDPWTYYPFKMLWFGSAFICLIIIPIVFVFISKQKQKILRYSLASLFTFTLLIALNWSIPKPSTFALKDISSIFFSPQGELFNDEVATQMFKDDNESLVVYWISQRGDQASALNFWNISNWANSLKPNVYDIRYLAYYLPPTDPKLLCDLASLAKTELKVVSSDDDLQSGLDEFCPDLPISISRG
ncbi:hypothetical protein [Aurantimicrobium minutum]|uniref:hypothetical protein n=1 Tax=Aurantimicrobium minutum TaxID=708131 RepID=UPI0024768741|nr:hypothetical protein [Aurantimicrobium minutum]MDH6238985.1 hypothetical protein [Aurantimicrobium minutum]